MVNNQTNRKPRKEFRSTTSLADALVKTAAGRQLVVQAKAADPRAERKLNLRHMAYDTFVGKLVPYYGEKSWSTFNAMNTRILELGYYGGAEYDRALNLLKHAWTDYAAYTEAVNFMTRRVGVAA